MITTADHHVNRSKVETTCFHGCHCLSDNILRWLARVSCVYEAPCMISYCPVGFTRKVRVTNLPGCIDDLSLDDMDSPLTFFANVLSIQHGVGNVNPSALKNYNALAAVSVEDSTGDYFISCSQPLTNNIFVIGPRHNSGGVSKGPKELKLI